MKTKRLLIASLLVALCGCQPQAPEQKAPAAVAPVTATAPAEPAAKPAEKKDDAIASVKPATPEPVPAPVEKAAPATPKEKLKPAAAIHKSENVSQAVARPSVTTETADPKVEKIGKKVSGDAAETAGKNPQIAMKTSEGMLVIELFQDKSPISVANFLQYTKDKFYDGTIFHRVIDGFMIQGGGYTSDMKQKGTRAPIQNEAQNGLKNMEGTVAMARTRNPDSATAQFFINVADNVSLDYPKPDGAGYTVFGKVVSGMDVVQKIRIAATENAAGQQNVPKTPIIIESVALLPRK